MAYEHQEYPKYLYHPKHAPEGKVFQSAAEIAGLEGQGWVDTPAKFPKRSARSLAELKDDYDAAEEEFHQWVTSGKCLPHSEMWERVNAKYQVARDAYEFAMRHAQLAPPAVPSVQQTGKKAAPVFETAFSKYTVKGLLGQGGTGKVYKVEDEGGGTWAIKCLQPNAVSRDRSKRFKNEIAFCSTPRHPNIIRIEESGVAEVSGIRVPFYVMPQYSMTLRQLLRAGIAHAEALSLFDQLLSALEAAHQAGVWHRDLKPENVLYDSISGQLIVADFGIAHFAETVLHTTIETSDGDKLANFQYAAPEQRAFRPVDQRADIYALGVILNEMFTGEILQGTGHKTIASVAPDFAHLDAIVERMVRQSPDDRPASVAEIRAALPPLAAAASATGNDVFQVSPGSQNSTPPSSGAPPDRKAKTRVEPPKPEDVFERLRLHIFLAADARKPSAAHFDEYRLSNQFELNVSYIQELFLDLHLEKAISIAKWDGTADRPLDQWPSPEAFFDYRADGGYIRTTLLRRGKQLLEQLKNSATVNP